MIDQSPMTNVAPFVPFAFLPAVLFHQKHLARPFNGAVQLPLVMGGQAGVFAREDAALVGHELFEEGHILKIQGIKSEVNLGFGPGSADFNG